MTYLNTSILFSLLLAVGLFGLFKLCRNWSSFFANKFGNLLKVLISLALIILILIGAFGAYINFNSYITKEKLRVFNEVSNIKLGIAEDDLTFMKGKPTKSNKIESQTLLLFDDGLVVAIDKGKVTRIEIRCQYMRLSYSFSYGGISCGSSLDSVIASFGEPDNISVTSDKTARTYNYLKYNIAFELSKSSVTEIIIFDADEYKNGLQYIEEPKKQKKSEAPVSQPNQNTSKVDAQNSDHCAPNLSREERLRRLALSGVIRETSYQTFSNGKHFVSFLSTGSEISSCR